LKDGLFIGRNELGFIATKFGKVIICFETGGGNVKGKLIKRTVLFFLNIDHHFYLTGRKYKYLFKKYYDIINNDDLINTPKLPPLNESITNYNNFIDPNPPITKNSTI
jgi:hypothetical protein